MKKFLLKGFLYSFPLLISILIVYIIDPYYLFHKNRDFNEQKFKIGYSFDQGRRYKIFTYKNNPKSKIILGASEINVVSELNIPEEGWHSLSYGGAPIQESLKMFWVIANEYELTDVIIAPEFIKYFNAISSGKGDPYYANFNWNTSQSKQALDIYDSKFDYFTDKYVLKSSWNYVKSFCMEAKLSGNPNMDKELFWKSQLDYASKVYDGNTLFHEKKIEVISLFREIQEYCKINGIQLRVVIPIQHVDLLKLEFCDSIYPIYYDYINYLVDIFGSIYYFAYDKEESIDNSKFSDPFHYLYADLYLRELFYKPDTCYIVNKNNINILNDFRTEILNQ